MHGMYDGGMGAGGWLLMSFVWLALVVLIVLAAAHLFPRREGPSRQDRTPFSRSGEEQPLEILDRRLARGEIDLETYDELRKRLADGASVGRK